MQNLSGKVALVTGGAVRVGRSIALALAEAGADVILNYWASEEAALATARDIETLGRRALPFRADVSDATQIASMVAAGVSALGRLDILVNSASLWQRTPWSSLDEAAWDRILDVNLKGPFLCARAAAEHLRSHGDGAIVNIVDQSVFVPFPNLMPHSAAKSGLLSLTYSLAMELAPEVRVNAVAPGPVLPPPDYGPEQIAAKAKKTLLKRWGRPEDVAQAVLYLLSAPFVTGIVLPVDGGEHLARR